MYQGSVYPLEERWEALEKGKELAQYENITQFKIGQIDKNNNIINIEIINID